ncbi:DNA cytosine methyltransferase [Escherichia coli]
MLFLSERLQGFPDGYTDIPWKNSSPAHRYKAIGNSMPVPVMKWIGRRIQEALNEV